MAGFRLWAVVLVLQLCISTLLFFASPTVAWEKHGATRIAVTDDGYQLAGQAGGRKLLQSTANTCQYDFSKVDFSSVTSVCTGPNYDTNVCCAPFNALACQYKPQINDFNSLCPIYFLSYLDVAGGYSSGVFVGAGRCNNGNTLCSD